MRSWRQRLGVWHRPAREIEVELEFHLDERASDLVAQGMVLESAREQARREFGDLTDVRTGLLAIDKRSARRRSWRDRGEWLGQDLRYVVRSLRRSPGLVLMVVMTLALGLGVNGATFSVLDRLFLAAPPGVGDPEAVRRLYRMYPAPNAPMHPREEGDYSLFSVTELQRIDALDPSHAVMGADMRPRSLPFGSGADQSEVRVGFIVGDYFGALGVRPLAGRLSESRGWDLPATSTSVVVSDAFWRTRLNHRADIVGSRIEVNHHFYVVTGIATAGFHGADNDAADLWLPLGEMHWLPGMSGVSAAGSFWIRVLVRADSPVARSALLAAAQLAFRGDGISHDPAVVASLAPLVAAAEPGQDGHAIGIVLSLTAVALAVFLIACANVTTLMLARGMQRRREIAVRLALGIRRRRLVLLLLLESACLMAIGLVPGLLIAARGAVVLRTLVFPDVHWIDAPINAAVLVGMTLLFLAAGLLSGLVPAVALLRSSLTQELKRGGRGVASTAPRLRAALLVVQVMFAVVLLAGAGVFVRSLRRIASENVGYDVSQVVFAEVRSDADHPGRRPEIPGRLAQLAQAIGELPGVGRVALGSHMPMATSWGASVYTVTRDSSLVEAAWAGPGFLETIGLRLVQGRDFSAGDWQRPAVPLIVNQTLAHQLWPGQDPRGYCLRMSTPGSGCGEVIGVVSDAHEMRIDEAPVARVYAPLADSGHRNRAGVVAVRAMPGQIANVRRAVDAMMRGAFTGWATPRVLTVADLLQPELRPWRVSAALFSGIALLALLVTVVGVYSLISFSFSQRTHELGIRASLGADPAALIVMVMRESVRLVGIGLAIGVALSLAAGRLVESMLYHTSARDPEVLVAVSLVLIVVALVAATGPAWRASRADPMVALREE